MKVSKAIEVIADLRENLGYLLDHEGKDAVDLGIEALKAIEKYRRKGVMGPFLELPGETQEEGTEEVTHEQSH